MNTPIFNTDAMQSYPDFFVQPPVDVQLVKKNNNPRYKFFRQNHFTAGDEDQFLEYWDRSIPCEDPIRKHHVNLNKEIPLHPNTRWSKYRGLCVDPIISTYHYISDKFKKGIFLKITDGKPKVFLPFSKVDYQNEWSDKIKTNPRRFSNIFKLMKYTADVEKRDFTESKVHKNVKAWYGNNGLVRLEFPTSEGDSGVNMIRDMFVTLMKERKLPSCELFINKRDFPLLKKDGTESYNSFFGNKTKLLSHSYDKYAPILGMTTTDDHADIPIPTWEDWSRIAYWSYGRVFGKEFRTFHRPEEFDTIEWETKIPTAVFRGASTGQGTMLENNIRLLMAAESVKNTVDKDGIPFLDVGITKWNLRPRKHPSYPYIETIHVEEMPFSLATPLDPLQQAGYKYILHLPGHSEAYRLGMELYSGSVILYYPCEYYLWFFKWMKPWEHYVPLSGSVDDIYEKIRWCKENDEKCKIIAQNARDFARKYLSKDGVLDYLQNTIWDLYSTTGRIFHTKKSLIDHNIELYRSVRADIFSPMEKQLKNQNFLENIKACYLGDPLELSKEVFQFIFFAFHDKIDESATLLKESKNTRIFRFDTQGKKFMIKKTKPTWKLEEKFQVACGYLSMNQLSKLNPHFVYTYFDYEEKGGGLNIITDFVDGPTLEEYINLPSFKMSDLIDIYLYVCVALYEAQQDFGFLHMDLYPWNIMIDKKSTPVETQYNIDRGSVEIVGSVLPVLIDYGKSHFIHNDTHYYNTCPFHMCRLQDVISIVFSSLYIVLEKHKLGDKEIRTILSIMNFFSGSEYTNKSNFSSVGQVKSFLKRHKKYSKMLSEPKTGLENKSPMDFFRFLMDQKFQKSVAIHFTDSKKILLDDYRWVNSSLPMNTLRCLSVETELMGVFMDQYTKFDWRKHWIILENLWEGKQKTLEDYYFYNANIYHLFNIFVEIIQVYEKKVGKIWDQLNIEDLCKNFPPPSDIRIQKDWLHQNEIYKSFKLPVYPTHVCKSCLSKVDSGISIPPDMNTSRVFLWKKILDLKREESFDFFSIYLTLSYQKTCKKLIMD